MLKAERSIQLRYTIFGTFEPDLFQIYNSIADVPALGAADRESSIASRTFLIYKPDMKIQFSRFANTTSGADRFCLDQLHNQDSVTFTPGGAWENDVLLQGRIATASSSKISLDIMRMLNRYFKSEFTKLNAYLLGSGAMEMLRQGKRLTSAAQSPPTYDLKFDAKLLS